MDALSKAKIFTKIDLKHAYHLVHIAAGDEWKTAIQTKYRSFEWLIMPFGLTNSPGGFQRFLNTIFDDILDIFVIIGPGGVHMDEEKVKVIQDWPEPLQVKDIQSFLGFTNFYRRFIHDYSNIVVPLTRLT